MFLLLPVGYEMRWVPFGTFALIALNLIAFGLTWPKENAARAVALERVIELSGRLKAILADPKSDLKAPLRAVLQQEQKKEGLPSAELRKLFARVQSDAYTMNPKGRYEWDLVYPIFEASDKSLRAAPDTTTPFLSWGLGTARSFATFFTHQFLHAGWLHLGFNMLFLWVVGSALEHLLGFWIFPFYLLGGVAAAAAQLSWGLAPGDVLVGASGSISALMGLALVLMPQAKIKLFYVVMLSLLPRGGFFNAPLWFFLPIWAFQQILMLLMTAKSAVQEVAYMAHVGGFAAGLVGALIVRATLKSRLYGTE